MDGNTTIGCREQNRKCQQSKCEDRRGGKGDDSARIGAGLPWKLVPSGVRSRAAQAKAPFWKHVMHTNQISPSPNSSADRAPKVSFVSCRIAFMRMAVLGFSNVDCGINGVFQGIALEFV